MYEQQRDSLASQSFNLDQVGFAIETSKDTMDTVKAMKSSAKELKNAYNSIKISEIEAQQHFILSFFHSSLPSFLVIHSVFVCK